MDQFLDQDIVQLGAPVWWI